MPTALEARCAKDTVAVRLGPLVLAAAKTAKLTCPNAVLIIPHAPPPASPFFPDRIRHAPKQPKSNAMTSQFDELTKALAQSVKPSAASSVVCAGGGGTLRSGHGEPLAVRPGQCEVAGQGCL